MKYANIGTITCPNIVTNTNIAPAIIIFRNGSSNFLTSGSKRPLNFSTIVSLIFTILSNVPPILLFILLIRFSKNSFIGPRTESNPGIPNAESLSSVFAFCVVGAVHFFCVELPP